ncbi:MAG: YcgN family cysteine cluster protein [Pseudomonadota bacterium]
MNQPASYSNERPFWERLRLEEMSTQQWESLCDGCGRCCLSKLEDWDTGEIYHTNVACTLFDDKTCACIDYENRFDTVPDCIKLTPQDVPNYHWLPKSCAYRRLSEGRGLAWWHPLVSGDPQTVHSAGISVQGMTISEDGMEPQDLENHLVDWLDGEIIPR